jgi:hypothetical protein
MHGLDDLTDRRASGRSGAVPTRPRRRSRGGRLLATTQGVFYLVTGAWPIANLRSFEAVTGPKHDDWLVRTTGGLIAATGAGLILRRNDAERARPFGATSSAVLLLADLIGVGSGRLRPVYLLDALAEAVLLCGWLGSWVLGRRRAREDAS